LFAAGADEEFVMADVETTHTPAGSTTVVEKSGSGGAGAILIAIVLLVAVVIGGFYLFGRQGAQNSRDSAITGAAKSVGSAADKAGDAATTAASKQ
jgi:uncharacterized protein HemX